MEDKQIPRQAIIWLLLAEAVAALPLVWHLPVWLWIVSGFVFAWRWLTHLGRLPYPSRSVKTLLVVVSLVLIYWQFGRSFNLESASSFLVAASLLKLLEMRYQRDAYVVVFLAFFVQAVGFLFEQGIVAGIGGIFTVWVLVSALIALHFNPLQSEEKQRSPMRAGQYAATVLAVSVPLMLVFYLLFPRMSPLWSFTLSSGAATTGLSDQMSPGDIASLGQSDELAFRVSFDQNELPARSSLYWRAVIFSVYDGRRWRIANNYSDNLWAGNPALQQLRQGTSLGYDIISEPNQQRWMYALKNPVPVERGSGLTVEGLLEYRKPIFNRMRYRVESYPDAELNSDSLDFYQRQLNLSLPDNSNPQSRWLAERLKLQYQQPQQRVQALYNYFSEQPFYYTLRPPILGQNDIDEFMFDSRRGFCEHFAGAFVFIARAAGIPARVVTGYQGGEWNAENKFLSVRQYDAHAWSEVWLQDRGWVRIDPVAAVAPERIEYGLQNAVKDEGSFLQDQTLSVQKLTGIGWINAIRLRIDSMNYYWQRWVLSYDNETQKNLLQNFFGLESYTKALKIMAGSLVVFFFIAWAVLWFKGQLPRRDPFMRQWQALENKAQQCGIPINKGESSAAFLQRLAQQKPQLKAQLLWLVKELNQSLYRDDTMPDKKVLRELSKVRRQLK